MGLMMTPEIDWMYPILQKTSVNVLGRHWFACEANWGSLKSEQTLGPVPDRHHWMPNNHW